MFMVLGVVLAVQPAGVPLPPPRPAIPERPVVAVESPHGPATDCDRRLSQIATFGPRSTIEGPGQCGAQDLVALTAVRLQSGKDVAVQPSALLRCEMAESFATWIRDHAAPRLASLGGGLVAVRQEDAYSCRNRNRAVSGKMSEHARGNAIDIQSFILADRHAVAPTDVNEPKDLRADLRESACRYFTTVLGPGEPAHDEHIHLDVLQRRGGYRICSWDVREPAPPAIAKVEDVRPMTTGAAVPLPPVRKHAH